MLSDLLNNKPLYQKGNEAMNAYQEFIEDVLEGYHEAGIVSAVDKETIDEGLKGDGTFCDECGTKMRYEGWLSQYGESYRALAICTNPECQNCFEF